MKLFLAQFQEVTYRFIVSDLRFRCPRASKLARYVSKPALGQDENGSTMRIFSLVNKLVPVGQVNIAQFLLSAVEPARQQRPLAHRLVALDDLPIPVWRRVTPRVHPIRRVLDRAPLVPLVSIGNRDVFRLCLQNAHPAFHKVVTPASFDRWVVALAPAGEEAHALLIWRWVWF